MKDKNYENNRHKLVLERISLANSIKELPRVNISSFATFLADNIYFDKRHISSKEFKPFIMALIDNDMQKSEDVYDAFCAVLKKNYPKHSKKEYRALYNKLFATGRIANFGEEMALRSQKIKEIQDKIELKKHNDVMSTIENSTTIQELSDIKIPDLMEQIANITKNEVVPNIPKSKLTTLRDLVYNQEDEIVINKEIVRICESYDLNQDDTDNLYQQLATILTNKKLKYIVLETKAVRDQIDRIYLQEHLKTLEQINGALELKQLPINFGESIIRRYLSENSKTDVNDRIIPPYELRNFVKLTLVTGSINNELVYDALKEVIDIHYHRQSKEIKDRVFDSLVEKFNSLGRLDYFIEEVTLYNKRVNEFSGTSCIQIELYGYEMKNPDNSGGAYFILIDNAVDNLDINAIEHSPKANEFREELADVLPSSKVVGAVIYEKKRKLELYREGEVKKIKTNSLDELLVLREQILKETEEQLKAVDQEIAKRKRKGTKGNINE